MATVYGLASSLGLRLVEHENPIERSPLVDDWVFDLVEHFSPRNSAELSGWVDGIAVRGARTGGGPLHLAASFGLRLDAGLLVSANREWNARSPLPAALEHGGVELRCDEPHRFGASFRPILEAMRVLSSRLPVQLDDAGIRASHADPEPDDIRAMVNLVKAVEALATTLPMASAAAPHREAWAALAAERDWTFRQVPLVIASRNGRSVAVCATARRTKDGPLGLEVRATYKTPLRRWIHVADFSESNDEAIVVTGGSDCQGALPPPARALMREWARAGHISMDDRGLRLALPLPVTPAEAIDIVTAATSIADESWQFATGEVVAARSPYR